jgi:hypothetical protein
MTGCLNGSCNVEKLALKEVLAGTYPQAASFPRRQNIVIRN